jgi:hypothetical protein
MLFHSDSFEMLRVIAANAASNKSIEYLFEVIPLFIGKEDNVLILALQNHN